MEFTELTEQEFTKFAENHPQFSFFQTKEIAELRERKGWQKHYVGVKDGKKILAGAMMVSKVMRFGKKIFYSPRGPLIDYDDPEIVKFFFKNLKKYLKTRGAYVFRFDPYFELQDRDIDGNVVKDGENHEQAIKNLTSLKIKIDPHPEQLKWMFALDLKTTSGKRKSRDEIKKDFRPNTRNLINKTLKTGIKVRELKKEELGDFKAMCTATAERKGFTKDDKSLKYYQDMYDLFGKNVKFEVAELDLGDYEKRLSSQQKIAEKMLKEYEKDPEKNQGRIKEAKVTIESLQKQQEKAEKIRKEDGDKIQLSCGMFLLPGKKEIIYLISGNSEKYMFFDAQYLIQWEIINLAVKNRYDRYNFYGISGIFDKSHPTYGMYEFKKGFGGHVLELIGGFEMPVSGFYYFHKLLAKIRNR